MSLFNRTARAPEPSPPAVTDHDLAAAASILGEFSIAASRDDGPGVISAGLRLAQVGGFRGLRDLFERSRHGGPGELYRQWEWLSAVANLAGHRSDTPTIALAFLFMDMWRVQVAPTFNAGDLDEIGFPAPPEPVQAALTTLALAFLADQPPDRIIAHGPSATIQSRHVVEMASMRILDLHRAGVAVGPLFIQVAQRVLGQRQ